MKTYRLKDGVENFDVVDGPFAGRRFLKGLIYTEIPPGETDKFEEIEGLPAGRQGSGGEKPARRTLPRLVSPATDDVKEE